MALTETAFYIENKQAEEETFDSYDAVLFTVCDILGRPRGKFAFGQSIEQFAKHGMDVPYTTNVLGLLSEAPTKLPYYNGANAVTRKILPDLSTLRPLSWLCDEGRKIGHVLCDIKNMRGSQDTSSPRAIALKQLDNLKELGFVVMSSFETEYIIFHKGTLNPLGGNTKEMYNLVRLDSDLPVLYEHMIELLRSGVPIETHLEEAESGQIEFSMQPQYGIKMADCIHRLRYATKSICDKHGLEPTFMARPKHDKKSSGFHLNHSVWTLDGRNAFYDPNKDQNCSDVMRHWVAGLIHHGRALTALMNPTVNCYERLHNILTPNFNIWNYNDRNARLRVKTRSKNIHIEERIPSSASNPYLCLAGLVAAGADGIARKLEAPPPQTYRPLRSDGNSESLGETLPKTLEEALQALEEDAVLTQELGETFVHEYIALCKEFQLEKLKNVMDKEPNERFEAQRDLYLCNI